MELSEITGNNEVVTLSDITGQFKTKTQRQDFYEPQPDGDGPDDGLAALADPDGTALSEGTEEESQPMDPERARRTGMRIARVVDTAFSFAASSFIASGSDNEYSQNDVDFFAVGHGLSTVPPIFFTYATHFCIFATADNVKKRKDAALNFEAVSATVQEVNKRALSEPHFYRIIENE